MLVLHPWWGLNASVRGLCERLAADGFVAFAPDLYGGETTSDIAQATELSRSVDVEQAGSLVTGGLRRLLGHPATLGPTAATLGLSMGASWAIWLSAQEPEAVAAVVAFYGTESVPFEKTKARFLGHYGDLDEYEPIEDVRKLEGQIRAAGREVTFHVYPGAKHWFFESDVEHAYDPEAAGRAWDRTVAFLRAAAPSGESS